MSRLVGFLRGHDRSLEVEPGRLYERTGPENEALIAGLADFLQELNRLHQDFLIQKERSDLQQSATQSDDASSSDWISGGCSTAPVTLP